MRGEIDRLTDESDPNDWPSRKRAASVDFVLGLLDQAGRGEWVAWALGNAMSSIANRQDGTINAEQAQALQSAADIAAEGAVKQLAGFIHETQIRHGMRCLALQIDRWAEQRTLPADDAEIADAPLHARIFRNQLHNFDLCLQLNERTAKRHAERDGRMVATLAIARPSLH